MRTEDAIRNALRRHAATHVVNPTLPPSTLARARVSRFVAVAGVSALAATVIVAGLGLADVGNRSRGTLAPASESSPTEAPRESAGGASLLLVTKDGWRVTRADQWHEDFGEMTFKDDAHELELTWRPSVDHDYFVQDRRSGSADSWGMTVAGSPAIVFRYEGYNDFTALWREGDRSLELRGVFSGIDEYMAVAETLQYVTEQRWLAALPDDVVLPEQRPSVVEEMLADIPVHPEVDVEKLKTSSNVSERYQLGAKVSGAMACAWIEQWVDAKAAGDDASAQEALDVMSGSHDWATLQEMAPQGAWSEVVWEAADAMAGDGDVMGGRALTVVGSYRSSLGCDDHE